jgi:hypothetical protein
VQPEIQDKKQVTMLYISLEIINISSVSPIKIFSRHLNYLFYNPIHQQLTLQYIIYYSKEKMSEYVMWFIVFLSPDFLERFLARLGISKPVDAEQPEYEQVLDEVTFEGIAKYIQTKKCMTYHITITIVLSPYSLECTQKHPYMC